LDGLLSSPQLLSHQRDGPDEGTCR
jgi:hypothetical protein